MKNSKKLTIILLVLAIVTALSAGTLAIYTTTLDKEQMQTTVEAKEMFLTSGLTWGDKFAISIAPGDDKDAPNSYKLLTATDKTGATVTEVPLKVSFTPNASFETLINTCQGLEISLIEIKGNTTETLKTWKAGDTDSTYVYPDVLEAGSANERNFNLHFNWVTTKDQNDNDAANKSAVIAFTVGATQYVAGLE